MTVRRGDPCTIPDCGKPVVGRGWCSKHYAAWRNYGDPLHSTRRYEPQGKTCLHEDCDEKPKRRGLCEKHAKRLVNHGETTEPRERRFWAKVNKYGPLPELRPDLGPCWIYTGYVDPDTGYGQYGGKGGTRLPHRIAYEYSLGAIPKGLHLDHLCKRRICCRPSHLEPVTPLENIRRGDQGAFWGYVPEPIPERQKAEKPITCTTLGCERPVAKTTLCRPCYRKWLKNPARPAPPSAEERFWAKVDKDGPAPEHKPGLGPCWLWTAGVNRSTGYGRFGVRHGHMMDAHRYAYLMVQGSIPEGQQVHHECHVRRCVRIDHLRATTRSENMAERKVRRQP